jgi:hypothetical protein
MTIHNSTGPDLNSCIIEVNYLCLDPLVKEVRKKYDDKACANEEDTRWSQVQLEQFLRVISDFIHFRPPKEQEATKADDSNGNDVLLGDGLFQELNSQQRIKQNAEAARAGHHRLITVSNCCDVASRAK